MKKLIYLIMVLGLVFTACDPMDNIYSEIDAQEEVVVGDAIYTLTADDYDELGLNYGNFSSVDDVKSIMPAFLSDKYPVWGDGSSVLLGFDLYVGNADGVSDYTYADDYRLANADYPGASDNAVGFYPSEDPEDFLGDILAANIESPSEGDVILVKYKQYVGEPVLGISNYFEANFNGSLEDWDPISVTGDQVWYDSSYSGTEYAKMTGYSGGSFANEDWLVSPEIDLTSQTNLTFQVNQAINYADDVSFLSVLVSTDYDGLGDPSTATWNLVDFTNSPAGNNWTFILSEEYDMAAYEGETIHIAFKYISTVDDASTWEVDSAIVRTPGVEGDTINKEEFYVYTDGDWELSEGVYFLSDDDFDSMGEEYGQPGYYNNFGSSIPPGDYLTTFLGIKFPYALEETELFVIYDYYSSSSGAQLRGNLYTVIDGVWIGHESVISTTLQFGHDGTSWVPDNTIKYTLVQADYDLVGNGYYANFDVRAGKDEETVEVRLAKINSILLNNFPGMDEGQKFTVFYDVYSGAAEVWEMKVILSGGEYILQ